MVTITGYNKNNSLALVQIQSRDNFYSIKDYIKSLFGSYYDLEDRLWRISVLDVPKVSKFVSHISDELVKVDMNIFSLLITKSESKKKIVELNGTLEGVDCGVKLVDPYSLLPFQHIGVQFCYEVRNAIIADKVGLGKTIQGFSIALKFYQKKEIEKCLIIVPGSLKEKWFRDIEKFTGIKSHIIQGDKSLRKKLIKNFSKDKSLFAIISYDILRIDGKYLNECLNKKFSIIFDEVQKLKNTRTKRSIYSKLICSNSNCVSNIGLSATYVETGLQDLFGIMLIIDQSIFGNSFSRFSEHFLEFDYFGRITKYKNINLAHKKMKQVAIRRNKEQVKDQLKANLPAVNESTLWVELNKDQKKVYNDVIDKTVENLINLEKEGRINTSNAMSELVYLRQASISAEMINPKITHSAKMDALLELVPPIIEDNNKIVIFCFFTDFIDIMEREFNKCNINCIAMHGKRKEGKQSIRQKTVDNFSESKDINVLISSDILKEGIDIPAANYVINTDLLWNPAGMIQRCGRIDRLNQKSDIIYNINILAKDTIEDNLIHKIVYQREEVANMVIDGGIVERRIKKLNVKNIKSMLKVIR